MKRLFVVALLALAVPGVVFGQAATKMAASAMSKTGEQEVSALERAWIDADQKYKTSRGSSTTSPTLSSTRTKRVS